MSISINTNLNALRSVGRMHAAESDMTTSITRLSTGLRINSAKDDPAGLIAVTALTQDLVKIDAHLNADQRATFDARSADGKLAQRSRLLIELKSLVVEQANKSGLSDEEKQAN